MGPRISGLVFTIAVALLATPLAAEAQSSPRVPRIGVLVNGSLAYPPLEAFREGLRGRGYLDGQTIALEWRSAEGRFERLPELASELVRLKVDVLVTGSNPAVFAAKRATSTVPIVMVAAVDPVGVGLVASLARPGGNVTGLTYDVTPEQEAKALQLLKETAPAVSQVTVVWNSSIWGAAAIAASMREYEAWARAARVTVQYVEIRDLPDLERVLTTPPARQRASALFVVLDAFLSRHQSRLLDFAARHRLPTLSYVRDFPEAGGLMSYGPSQWDLWRRAAGYVEKILRGAKPAQLPVEQPVKLELVINLKTARALGLTIPQSVLIRADELIP